MSIYRGGVALAQGFSALPTPAQVWLVRAATGPADQMEHALREWRSLVDLSGPIDGGSYRLIPTVYHRMQELGVEDPNRSLFKGVYRRSMVENSQVVDSATPALQALASDGIVPWIVKGAGLVAAGYYPTLAMRPMADVDIVVTVEERDAAIAALGAIGYLPQRSARERESLHSAPFVDAAGLELDLHWHHLHHARFSEADEMLTRASVYAELNGVPVRVPGPTGLLIAIAVHGLNANVEPPVRWLVDAAKVLERDGAHVDWEQVVEFATRFRMSRRIRYALELLESTTGHAAPDSAILALAAAPHSIVERLERRLPTTPVRSLRGRALQMFAGYAGGDRELRHVATGLPRYIRSMWNLESFRQAPAVGGRKVIEWLRSGRS